MAADVAQLSKAGFTVRDIGDEISVSDSRLGVGAEAIVPGGFPIFSWDSMGRWLLTWWSPCWRS